ncbi:helix-turn-helix domain-containing protein [Streptosporangium jomthongense]|uniref:Helix-turn-helix domain-containing protein n=1 Tax=Streptosporangium jomthongense TaxID=1193683 RepID=A0ABV8EXI9_9ACTN
MPASPSSSAQASRERLGAKLRELRTEADITGKEFARHAGWNSASQVTMIEKGQRTITADYVRLWCRICEATEQQTTELLHEQAAVAGMWLTHTDLNRAGLRGRQERLRDKYWQVKLNRVYQTRVIPGLLQTPRIITAYLSAARADQHLEIDDVSEAVEARLDRQRCLDRPDARWLFLLEEDVLWYWPGPLDAHRDQLQYLLEVMSRPTVVLGIIPRGIHRAGVITGESFTMADTRVVTVELISGDLNITSRPEVQLYVEAWERFWGISVVGKRARALINEAITGIDDLLTKSEGRQESEHSEPQGKESPP